MKRGTGGLIGPQKTPTTSNAAGIWALWEQQKSQGISIWPAATPLNDALFNYVVSLYSGAGTNNANNNTFLDSSSNAFTVTRNGNATQGSINPYAAGTYSAYFDGTGDYLTWSGSAIGTNQFSIECWFNTGSLGNSQGIIGHTTPVAGTLSIRVVNATTIGIDRYNTATDSFTVPTMQSNTWYHLVACRDVNNNTTIFLNGTRSSTGAVTNANSLGTISSIGFVNTTDTLYYNGYISNVRIVVGSTLYSPTNTTITVPTEPLTPVSGTVLLTCASYKFIDLSNNNFTISRTGDVSVQQYSAIVSRSPSLPQSYSEVFNGSSNYLSVANNTNIQLGGLSTYTIEFWAYRTSSPTFFGIFSKGSEYGIDNDSSRFIYRVGGGNAFVINGTVDLNTWTHIALVANAGTVTLYKNGTILGTATTPTITNSTNALFIGYCSTGNAVYFPGNISNFRIVKGVAVYTGTSFTPPTAPLTNISGTGLLTCQSNYIVDNSSNNLTITTAGAGSAPTNSVVNPFAYSSTTQGPYSTTTFGGAAYFDGTGDYLTVADNAALDMTADFTLEGWFYGTSFPNAANDILTKGASATFQPYYVYVTSAGALTFSSSSNGTSYDIASAVSLGTVTINQWNHFAISRTGTALKLYLNGALSSTITNGTALVDNALAVGIGAKNDGTSPFTGYICNVRILKGTGLYVGPFTPPPTPLTNITNTSLLLNATNAAIFDYSMINDAETLGNAQVSTTQSKWGTGSLSFNGTNSYLSWPTNLPNTIAGDFTVEFWAYPTTTTSGCVVYINGNTSSFAAMRLELSSNAMNLLMSAGGSTWAVNTGSIGSVPINTWTYIAVTRTSNTVRIFINGTVYGTTYTSANSYAGTVNYVGAYNNGGAAGFFNGYINDLRITRYSRYTASFTAPLSPPPFY